MKKVCGAKTRAGGRCQRPQLANGRCRLHGGTSLKGAASAAFVDGRHSKYLPVALLPRFRAALEDTELVGLRAELALVDLRLRQLLEQLGSGVSASWLDSLGGAVESLCAASEWTEQQAARAELRALLAAGASEYARWAELGEQIDRRRKLVEAESKRLGEMGQKITVEQAMTFMRAVWESVRRHEPDAAIRGAIATDLAALGMVEARGAAGADSARSLPNGRT